MKRILLSVLALSLVLSGSAFATVRTNGMAIDQDDTNDYGNIYAFPHLTGKYANIFSIVPTGSGWDANGELLINAGDKTITLGYGSDDVYFAGGNQDWEGISNYVGYTGTNPDQKIQLGIALPMGSGLLGARFSWSRYAENETYKYVDDLNNSGGDYDQESVDNSSQIKVEVGYGMEEAGPFKSLDIGAKLALNSGEVWEEDNDPDNDDSTTTGLKYREGSETDGATDIEIRLRGVKEQGDGSLVFNLGFGTYGLNAEYFQQDDGDASGDYQDSAFDTDDTYRSEYKVTGITVGAAYNKPINDGGLLVIALRLNSLSHTWTDSETFYYNFDGDVKVNSTQDEYKWSYLELPISVGVEDKLSDTFKGRLGMKKNILNGYSYTNDYKTDYDIVADANDDTETEEGTYQDREDATLFMGLSATKGKFYSDWVIEHDLFWNGPFFVFGGSSNFAAEWEVGLLF